MIAEQASRSRFWPIAALPGREVELDVRLETPGEPGVDVDILLLDEPLPAAWDEAVVRHLYEGVHAGLAAAGRPLPDGGVRVSITKLRVEPTLAGDPDPEEVDRLADTVRAIVASTVDALWAGLSRPASAGDANGPDR
ncbi:MAG: hypothetical protein M3Q10_04445 [Chloroflexota bacterium]|nr:hypothetical protein [Chloroflexota bacterium]